MSELGDRKRRNKTYIFLLSGLILIVSPLLSAVFFCAKDGHMLTEVYFPLSGWSDEITYFKQIEAIVNGGIKGYFGFNQSKAMIGGLAYWGPFPLVPYCIWGWLFGWNYLSPIYANIALQMISMLAIFIILKPDIKRSLLLAITYVLLPIINRHVISCMAESFYIAMVSVCMACGVFLLSDKYEEKRQPRSTVAILCICLFASAYLTSTRAYYAILFLFPFVFACKNKKPNVAISSIVVCVFSFAIFAITRHFLCADYYGGVIGIGVKEKIGMIPENIISILQYSWYAIRYKDSTVSWSYASWLISLACVVLFGLFYAITRRRIEWIGCSLLIMEISLLFGVLILYNISVGGRHFLALFFANVIYLVLEADIKFAIPVIIIGVAQFWLINSHEAIPYRDYEYAEWLDLVKEDMNNVISLTDTLSYSNVLGMPTSDVSRDGTDSSVCTYYGYMFAAPAGMGISLDSEIFYKDISNINAKYVMAHPKGKISEKLEEAGWECILNEEAFAIYTNDRIAEK